MASPTTRTLAAVRATGGIAAVVEKWNAHTKIRQDVWGFGDILCAWPGGPVMLIQATGSSGMGARRVRKIVTECAHAASVWLDSGAVIEVWEWNKYKVAVQGLYWRARVTQVTVDMLQWEDSEDD